MRQFLKGKRLISLCEQKNLAVQRVVARLNSERKQVIDQINQCEAEIRSLEDMLRTLQFNDESVTKAIIYAQLRQQSFILHQRQNVILEHSLYVEQIEEIDQQVVLCQNQLALIKRKEMKFTNWMLQGKRKWTMQQESVNEDEKLDLFPWIKRSS